MRYFLQWKLFSVETPDAHRAILAHNIRSAAHPTKYESGTHRHANLPFYYSHWAYDESNPAATPQPAPKGQGVEIVPLVIADIQARAEAGKLKYGAPLRADNGRDALMDAYQEALDLACYLRQAIEERSK